MAICLLRICLRLCPHLRLRLRLCLCLRLRPMRLCLCLVLRLRLMRLCLCLRLCLGPGLCPRLGPGLPRPRPIEPRLKPVLTPTPTSGTHAYACPCAYACACACAYAYVCAQTYACAYAWLCVRLCVRLRLCPCLRVFIHPSPPPSPTQRLRSVSTVYRGRYAQRTRAVWFCLCNLQFHI